MDVQIGRIVNKKRLKHKLTSLLRANCQFTLGCRKIVYRITLILEMLCDGKWHRIAQLQQLMGLKDFEVKEITKFLSDYAFAEVDEENSRVRVSRDFRKILVQNAT